MAAALRSHVAAPLALTLALLAVPAAPAAAEEWAAAPLELKVNEVAQEGVVTVLLGADDVLLPLDVATRLHLERLGRRLLVRDAPWLSLRSMAPEVRYELDEPGLALRLTVDPRLLGAAVIDFAPLQRPAGLVLGEARSAFLNYSVQGRSNDQVDAALEGGAGAGGLLFTSGVSRNPTAGWVRGLSALTLDAPAALRRVTAGEAVASTGPLGGSAVLAGLGISREFSLDPYFVRGPLPRTTGLATTPSTVDVYVNGALVKQVPVAPGTFELANLPVTTGNGNIRTVVRDAFGRATELDARYYYSSGLLAKGLDDYAYQAGLLRQNFGRESFDYGGLAFAARHRWGLTEHLTAGYRLEGTTDRVSGGVTATAALWLGELEASAGASGSDRHGGGAGALSWSYRGRQLGVGGYVRAQTERYATLAATALDDRPLLQAGSFVGVPLGDKATLNLEYSASHYRDAGNLDAVLLRTDFRLGARASLLVGGGWSRSPSSGAAFSASAMLSWSFGAGTLGDLSADSANGGAASVGLQRSLPLGEGYGYQLRAGQGDSSGLASGDLQYQGRYGRYEVTYDRRGGGSLASATVAGGLVAIGDRVLPTRPVQDGYALVQVPGVEGVRAFLEGQEVGRTDARGDLLIPNLQAYYGNHVSIRATDVPMTFDVPRSELLIATPVRGGALARFPVEPIQMVGGEVRLEGRPEERPAYGELTIREGERVWSSPIEKSGRFSFERLPPGAHRAEVEWRGGRCEALLLVPDTRDLMVEVGRVSCRAAAAEVAQRVIPVDRAAP
ncbi:fimbria/pilus outer membrane usher protein [Anaeromyxobacter paludicola]|uniref:Fimbrial biogenesis outer membrane usher protein n=1 Tax=Anaeromyxobacter paludicola TaxID=2918171 RepID=A0ABN6N616_9BACT|nr:fimbria/pilus outer membrane usher protein [Anaeromyxobacter paludicola]BDG07548.1 hypothetical protein AMPC_06610 [Anaeromyxobacter paludicola]